MTSDVYIYHVCDLILPCKCLVILANLILLARGNADSETLVISSPCVIQELKLNNINESDQEKRTYIRVVIPSVVPMLYHINLIWRKKCLITMIVVYAL